MKTEQLLRLRYSMNKKRPAFLHQEHWKLKRFRKAPWRKPRGKRSKMRAKERAKPSWVTIGFRGPREVRGWHPRGMPEYMVYTVSDLKKPEKTCVMRIASSVGTRKRLEIVRTAVEKELYIVNPSIKFAKISSIEELESLIPIKKYIKAWYISEKVTEEDREEIVSKAEELGIEVVE